MADVLGTTFSVGNGLSQGGENNTELLVQAFRRTRQPAVDTLRTRQTQLEQRQVFFNRFRSRIDALQSRIDTLVADNAAASFVTRKASSSDPSVLTVTANADTQVGISQVKVNRLAANDTFVSDSLRSNDRFELAGRSQRFRISGKEFNISFAQDETNLSALTKIANALNQGTGSPVTASAIRNTSQTVRLSIVARQSGSDNQITFDDNATLRAFGLNRSDVRSQEISDPLEQNTESDALGKESAQESTATEPTGSPVAESSASRDANQNRRLFSATGAGFRRATAAELDASIEINGIEVTRNSNRIQDAVPGLDITILKPQAPGDAPVTVNADNDVDRLVGVIQPILDEFNATLRFLQDSAQQTRGDTAVRSVLTNLRSIAGREVATVQPGNPSRLTDIGVTINTDGTLAIGDRSRLQELLAEDPRKISDIFTSAGGFASLLRETLAPMNGDGGIIASRASSLRTQISSVQRQTTDLNKRIDQQSDSLRREYENLQRTFLQAQSQFTLLNGFQQR